MVKSTESTFSKNDSSKISHRKDVEKFRNAPLSQYQEDEKVSYSTNGTKTKILSTLLRQEKVLTMKKWRKELEA